MKIFTKIIFTLTFASLLIGCSGQKTALMDVKATSDKLTIEKAYNIITQAFIDKGFDIKIGNKDLGLVTTEYKKFGSVDGNPPFDFYLQIKAQAKTRQDGKIQITITPVIKESNRLNSAAFTERELTFLSEEEQKKYLDANEKTELSGQLLFLNVVQFIAEAGGLSMEQLEYNKQLREVKSQFAI